MASNEDKLTCAYNSKASNPRNWHEITRGEEKFLSNWTRKKKVSVSTELELGTCNTVGLKKGYSGP